MKRKSSVVMMILRGAGVIAVAFVALFVYLCRTTLRVAIGSR